MAELLETVALIDSRVLLVLCLVAIDVWVLSLTLRSGAGWRDKTLWTAVVLLCPIIGCLFWFSLGPKPDLLRGKRFDAP